ncbi:hypothetical protein BSL78_13667 [Apostichopus japonicus]|uniref:Endonuclease/exonuclease/phosphatase domain-containing protein n=1 Tax=Stichopus japonicus TaxID=307972 RepID=A0A2G8KN84_STIJA|nr:hypothetical protein BSL78_13667 [Apostichopus japonicus]
MGIPLQTFRGHTNLTELQYVEEKLKPVSLQHLQKFYVDTIPKNPTGDFVFPTVTNVQRTKLQCTSDNQTPLFYQEVSPSRSGDKFQKKKAIIGISFMLTLKWENTDDSIEHKFVVTLSRERIPYLYSHTFSLPSKQCHAASESNLRQEDCPTESSASLQGNCQSLDTSSSVPCQDEVPNKYTSSLVTVVTYNIWNFQTLGPEEMYYARIKRLGKLVSESQADVIAFQEVRFDFSKLINGPSQIDHLREYLPLYQFVFQPAMSFPKDFVGRIEEGLAIFSRYPIKSHDYILLSRISADDEDRHQRICLHAEIETPRIKNLHVFVTHLALSQTARERSVVEIWNFMEKYPGPALLMGDLNAEPHEKSIRKQPFLTFRFLMGEVEINGTRTEGLRDGWLLFHKEPRPNAPGKYQMNEEKDEGLTFSTLDGDLRKRIDYIFIREESGINTQSVGLLDDNGRQSVAASDHLGVKVVLNSENG